MSAVTTGGGGWSTDHAREKVGDPPPLSSAGGRRWLVHVPDSGFGASPTAGTGSTG